MAKNQFTPMVEFAEKYIDRFWSRVKKSQDDQCWDWTGTITHDGYGRILVYTKGIDTQYRTNRVAYFLSTGVDPGQYLVCHSCDNPLCCNPAHLWLGDNQANMLDMKKKRRGAIGLKSGKYTKPFATPRGDRHGSKTKPWAVRRGVSNGMAKYTEAQVLNIRRLAREGVRPKEIMAMLNIPQTTFWNIVNGRCWKHLPLDGIDIKD
jgi:hypothetical protein